MRTTVRQVFRFNGAHAPPVVGSRQGIWCSAITGAGPPTVDAENGYMALKLEATNEVQNACLYMGDILPFDIDDLIRIEALAKLSSTTVNAAISGVFGVGSARADDPDSVAEAALFKFTGSNSIVVESDDGTNNNDDVSTGDTLGTTWKRFAIDFATGIKSQSAPSLSVGGKADVRFLMSNSNGSLRRVAKATRFDMSNYAGNLQLLAQIQKTAATATLELHIREFAVEYQLNA